MYIGMRGHDFDTNTLDALCEKCKEYGVGGVQLVLLRSLADFKKGNFTPEYAKSIGDKLRENGIRVPILGCYINPSDANEESLNESLDYFIENLHYAKYIGAEMVGLETCRFSDDDEINNSEETYQYLLKNMKKLVSAAEEIGVNVGIEGVHFHVINTPTKMKRLSMTLIHQMSELYLTLLIISIPQIIKIKMKLLILILICWARKQNCFT